MNIRGENNPNWKGGIIKKRGYIYIYKPKHPNSDRDGYIREHRLVMSQELDRPLRNKECVHHINGKKSDNRIENLMLFSSNSAHKKYETPWKGKNNPKYNGGLITLKCQSCRKNYKVRPYRRFISKYCSRSCKTKETMGKLARNRKDFYNVWTGNWEKKGNAMPTLQEKKSHKPS